MKEKFEQISTEPCPYISIAHFDGLEDFKTSLKRNLRQDINRRIRRAEATGTLQYKVYNTEEMNKVKAVLPQMLHFHRLRWPNAYKAPHFHENLLERGIKEGKVHFSQLSINEQGVSWRIGFVYKDTYYSYMPTIHPKYKDLSVGKIHLTYCIADAINKHLKTYDQLRGNELYKSEWTETQRPVYSFRLRHTSLTANIKRGICQIAKLIKK